MFVSLEISFTERVCCIHKIFSHPVKMSVPGVNKTMTRTLPWASKDGINTLSLGEAGCIAWVYALNSPINPSRGIAALSGAPAGANDGHDALMVNQYAGWYETVQVKAAKITVHFHSTAVPMGPVRSTDIGPPAYPRLADGYACADVVGISVMDGYNLLQVPGHYIESSKYIAAPIAADGTRTLSLEVDCAKHFGLSKAAYKADSRKRITTFPSPNDTCEDPLYFHVWTCPSEQGGTPIEHSVELFVTIEYLCEFTDVRTNVTQAP